MTHHEFRTLTGCCMLPVEVAYTHEPAVKVVDPFTPNDEERIIIIEIYVYADSIRRVGGYLNSSAQVTGYQILDIVDDKTIEELLKKCEAHFRSL